MGFVEGTALGRALVHMNLSIQKGQHFCPGPSWGVNGEWGWGLCVCVGGGEGGGVNCPFVTEPKL